MASYDRRVEFAVGFENGTWSRVTVVLQEPEERVFDEIELLEAAGDRIDEAIPSNMTEVFRHVLAISEPEGGYGED